MSVPSGTRARGAATAMQPPRCSRPSRDGVDLPSFTAVVDAAVTSAEVSLGVLPIESSLIGPIAETHDLLLPRAALDRARGDAARSPTASSACRARPRRCDGRALASRGVRPVPRPARAIWNVQPVPAATTADAAREVPRAGDPAADCDRERRSRSAYGLQCSPTTSATARVHALRRARAVHAGRRRRGLAHGAVVRHRPPAWALFRALGAVRAHDSISSSSCRGRCPTRRGAIALTSCSTATCSTRTIRAGARPSFAR